MAKRKRARDADASVEVGLIPILSCMFLMIPALLLAMEVARMVAISVVPPRFMDRPGGDPPKPELEVAVHIREDGFTTRVGEQPKHEVGLGPDGHDFAALEHWAAQLSSAHPDHARVEISAEGDVPLQTLVDAMDALRGRGCRLAGVAHGQSPSEGCYLWLPVVTAG